MGNGKALCLNMIVKNETANLERCLNAVAPYISCWVIGDTGSTDGTQDFIESFFTARNIPGELHSFPFHNFEQARNAALDCAYASTLAYDYLLFDDADMELVVEDRDFREKLEAPCYDILQRSSIIYWNPRIVRRDVGARYRGVTHEYLAVPGGGTKQLHGVWYRDHASGSNRVKKFKRDIRLLKEGLKSEPGNQRYVFYLAQSYRDAGQTAKAAKTFAQRAAMAGWDEEAWYARLQEARCLRTLGDEGGFLRQALAAFNQRPHRAEPLYDIARFYRERGMNDASALFCEQGLAIRQPTADILFIEDFVYTAGLKEEYSITANYSRDPVRKDRGFAACNWLALNRTIPTQSRDLARLNLFFYLKSAKEIMPSFAARQIGFVPPDGYRPTNPSVTRLGDQTVVLQRAVNFTLTAEGTYQTPNNAPIHTRNFLLRLDANLAIRSSSEVLPPADIAAPAFPLVQGFEDARLFAWRDQLWCISCVRELSPEGWADQVLARIDESSPGSCRLTDWRVLRPEGPRLHEKNWMPHVVDDQLQFIYLCDPTRVIDESAHTLTEATPAIAAEQFRGGTQAIAFDGGWLALVHEVSKRDELRFYQHRFVWFDSTSQLRRVSRAFYFFRKGVEFAAGLTHCDDRDALLISFGVGDGEAWIATVEAREVQRLLDDVEQLQSGESTTGRLAEEDDSKQQEIAALSSPEDALFLKLLRDARQKEQLSRPDDQVIAAYLRAAAACPTRAEALHEAARFCRIKGMNEQGCEFAAKGLAIAYPNGAPGVEDWIYEYGLQQEFSITANYARDPAIKHRGFAACNWLALNRGIPEDTRNLALSNLYFYIEPAVKMMPSFAARPVGFAPPDGYWPMNPSIMRQGDEIVLVQRAVNYIIDHTTADGDYYTTPDGAPMYSRNFLLRLDDDLTIRSSSEILPPEDMPKPVWLLAQGFEDLRPFAWRDALWCIACLRELSHEGRYEQVLARIDERAPGPSRLTDWRVLRPALPQLHEKNWMPRVAGDALQFIYLCDPTRLVDDQARTVAESTPPIVAEKFRGGSQLVSFDGGWLALVHEVRVRDKQRHYRHRFVWFDEAARLRGISRQFFFQKHAIEFAAGLVWHPDGRRLVVTYGVEDHEAWVATVDADDVRRVLENAERLPSATSGTEPHGALITAADGNVSVGAPAAPQSPAFIKSDSPSSLHFIVGVPRSGTTLFRAMLGAHPSICAPSETPWLTGAYGGTSLRQLLHDLVDAGDGPVKNIQRVSKADVSRAAERFVLEMFATKMQLERKEILVLKTPDDIWFVDELIEFFPHAQIFHMRRDVRDVALSTVDTGLPVLNHFGDNNFANAVRRWIAWETKIEQIAKTHTNIHSFRFEDLLANPKTELERAVRILGVPFAPRMLDYGPYVTDAPAWEVGSRDLMRQTSLNANRAWAHRSVTPTAAQRQVIEESAEQIEALGYPRGWQLCLSDSSPSASVEERILIAER